MEVGVKVVSLNPITGERRQTTTAYLTFVALDSRGKPVEVPGIIPETEDEKNRYENAKLRRQLRLERRQEFAKRKGLIK